MMKKYILFSTVFLLLVLFATNGFAASSNSFKFSDTFTEKLGCSSAYKYCESYWTGKYQVDAKISLAGIDITKFNKDTIFVLQVGYLDVEAVLGDDSAYSPGKTSAMLYFYDEYEEGNILLMTAKLKWTAKQLTIQVKGVLTDTSSLILALDYLYENESVNDNIDGYIAFGNADKGTEVFYDANIRVTGNAKTKISKKYGYEYELSTVSLKGAGGTAIQTYY
jgi:hypothetical protein